MKLTGGFLLAACFLFAGVIPAAAQQVEASATPIHVLGIVVGPDGEARIVCRRNVGSAGDVADAGGTNRLARRLFEPISDLSSIRWHEEDVFVAPRTTPDKAGRASATFQVEYSGFSSEARAAFQYAVDIWSTRIVSSVTIHLEASWSSLDENVLGSAGPTYFDDADTFSDASEPTSWFVPALANAKRGTDDYPDEVDVVANFNSDFDNWYFGLDGQTPPGMIDFVTVVLHEIGHGVGFLGSMKVDNGVDDEDDGVECEGTAGEGCWGFTSYPDIPVIYDRFAEDSGGNPLINTSIYPNPSSALGDVLQGGPVLFAGAEAVATYAGARPPLYVPSEWERGSSYSHLDEATFSRGDPSALMTPSVSASEAVHDPGPIGCAVFADIGWTTTSDCGTLAEPETPAVPVLESPPDGAEDLEPPVTFVWHSADRADAYDLQVSATEDFQSPGVSAVGISDTSYTVEQLESDTKYYWRVRSSNADAISAYSTTYEFVTAPPPAPAPAAPTLTSPENGATGLSTDITLQWEAGADASSFQVQVAETDVFDAPVVDETTASTSLAVSDLDDGTTYYWRVRGLNESGSGTWSDVFSFATFANLPVVPDVIHPADGATDVSIPTEFAWSEAVDADFYEMEVALDSAFADLVVDSSSVDTTHLLIHSLEPGTTYYWRVRAINDIGNSLWTVGAEFRTVVDTAGEGGGRPPERFGFTAAYPNPFHDRVTLDFVLPHATNVRLSIFDLQGRRVDSLVDGHVGAGSQAVTWTPVGLPSGVYVCRLEAEPVTSIRKIIFIHSGDE